MLKNNIKTTIQKLLVIETDEIIEIERPIININNKKNKNNSGTAIPFNAIGLSLNSYKGLSIKLNTDIYILSYNGIPDYYSTDSLGVVGREIKDMRKVFDKDQILMLHNVSSRYIDYGYIAKDNTSKIKIVGEAREIILLDNYEEEKAFDLLIFLLKNSDVIINDDSPESIKEYKLLYDKYKELNSKKATRFLNEIKKFYDRYDDGAFSDEEGLIHRIKFKFMSKSVSLLACEHFLRSVNNYVIKNVF